MGLEAWGPRGEPRHGPHRHHRGARGRVDPGPAPGRGGFVARSLGDPGRRGGTGGELRGRGPSGTLRGDGDPCLCPSADPSPARARSSGVSSRHARALDLSSLARCPPRRDGDPQRAFRVPLGETGRPPASANDGPQSVVGSPRFRDSELRLAGPSALVCISLPRAAGTPFHLRAESGGPPKRLSDTPHHRAACIRRCG
jgi:hypothetical protein